MSKVQMLQAVKQTILASSIGLSLFSLSGCGDETVTTIEPTPMVKPALTEIVSTQRHANLSFNGVVRAAERADLSFRMSGLLTELTVNEGDHVTKGQLLAKLDARDAKTALESAQLELENTEAEYKRANAIYNKSKAIAKSDLDAITTRYNLAKNRLAEAKRQLEYTELTAPFDGIIGRKLVDNHVQVQANAPVLTLHDLQDLEVVIHIPHKVMLSDTKNSQAEAELSIIPTERFPLSLRTYATQADPITQTYAVVLGFDDLKGYRVLPGMAVKVLPTTSEQITQDGQITVPLTALVPDNQGKQFVWVVDENNVTEKRYVEIGALSQDRVVIQANLKPGERVIIAGVSSVKEGMEVRPYTDNTHGV